MIAAMDSQEGTTPTDPESADAGGVRVGLVLGDPCGVGPEVSAKLAAAVAGGNGADRDEVDLVVITDAEVFRHGCEIAGVKEAAVSGIDLVPADLPSGVAYTPGKATAAGGAYALAGLRAGLRLLNDDAIDALCYAPLNKEALALAGSDFADEFGWLVREMGYNGPFCDCTVLEGLWTARVTSHVPIAEVADHITEARVLEVGDLIHRAIRRSGVARPRLAVAALNPHAGDGGLIGREEIEVLGPAVAALQERYGDVEGPLPSDTVFLRGRDGDFDGVICMYHDQGQTALKLMGFGRAISVLAGPDTPIATPAQGTAFDIVGQGIAKPDGMLHAFQVARRLGAARRRERG